MVSFYEHIRHLAIPNFGKKSKIIGGRRVYPSSRPDRGAISEDFSSMQKFRNRQELAEGF